MAPNYFFVLVMLQLSEAVLLSGGAHLEATSQHGIRLRLSSSMLQRNAPGTQQATQASGGAAYNPDAVEELKSAIGSEQAAVTRMQDQISKLLEDMKLEQEAFKKEKSARQTGGADTVHFEIEFPRVHPKTPKKEKKIPGAPQNKTAEAATSEKSLESTGSIASITIQSDSPSELEMLSHRIREEVASKAALQALPAPPAPLQLKPAEERMSDGIKNIDELEFEKRGIEADKKAMQEQYGRPLW